MLKRTLLLLSVIFAGSLLVAITAKSNNQVISSEEVQKMNKLRNKMIQSKKTNDIEILYVQRQEKILCKNNFQLEKSY